jgi:hypothetical protein
LLVLFGRRAKTEDTAETEHETDYEKDIGGNILGGRMKQAMVNYMKKPKTVSAVKIGRAIRFARK